MLLVIAIAIGIAGCATTTPVPSNTVGTPTAMTEAEVWKILEQRPLHVPTLVSSQHCPSTRAQVMPYFGFTSGQAFVYPRLDTIPFASAQKFANGNPNNGGWGGQKELWLIQPPYNGLVLIRGHQLDGSNPVQFNGGIDQDGSITFPLLTALRLEGNAPSSWPTYTRLRAPGCYIYQIDGLTFSGYLIFQATFS